MQELVESSIFFFLLQSNREFVEGFQCVQERRSHNASQLNAIYRSDKFLDFKLFKDEYTYPESFDWRTGGAVTQVKDQVRRMFLQLARKSNVYIYMHTHSFVVDAAMHSQQRELSKESWL